MNTNPYVGVTHFSLLLLEIVVLLILFLSNITTFSIKKCNLNKINWCDVNNPVNYIITLEVQLTQQINVSKRNLLSYRVVLYVKPHRCWTWHEFYATEIWERDVKYDTSVLKVELNFKTVLQKPIGDR